MQFLEISNSSMCLTFSIKISVTELIYDFANKKVWFYINRQAKKSIKLCNWKNWIDSSIFGSPWFSWYENLSFRLYLKKSKSLVKIWILILKSKSGTVLWQCFFAEVLKKCCASHICILEVARTLHLFSMSQITNWHIHKQF